MRRGRLTIVEASLLHAVCMSRTDMAEAQESINETVGSMSKADLKSSDVHPILWRTAVKVTKGQAPM